jgi:hypothetical protein
MPTCRKVKTSFSSFPKTIIVFEIKVLSHEEKMAQENEFVSPANLIPIASGDIFSPGPAEELMSPNQKEALQKVDEKLKIPKIKLKPKFQREELPPMNNTTKTTKLRDRFKKKNASVSEKKTGTLQSRLKIKEKTGNNTGGSRLRNRLRKKDVATEVKSEENQRQKPVLGSRLRNKMKKDETKNTLLGTGLTQSNSSSTLQILSEKDHQIQPKPSADFPGGDVGQDIPVTGLIQPSKKMTFRERMRLKKLKREQEKKD